MPENLNPKFEQIVPEEEDIEEEEQSEKTGFNYIKAEKLARKSLNPLESAEVDKKIKKLYGSCVEQLEKCPAKYKIFQLEVDRQRLIMAQENRQEPKIKARQINYDSKQNVFVYKSKNNYDVKATVGDLVSDIDWDLYYEIDTKSHPELADFKKDYQAKIFVAQIAEVENEQLLIERIEIDKVEKHNTALGEAYAKTYQALLAKKEKRQRGESSIDRRSGFVFEKILSSLLSKLSYDLGKKWDFDVVEVNVENDVRDKIDLILRIYDRHRGVYVEKESTPEEIKKGFQVTLMRFSDYAYRGKQAKVEKMKERIEQAKKYGKKTLVDDVALISPGEEFEDVAGVLKIWERQDMVPGGPENFLSIEKIVDKYLKEIFRGTRLDFEKNQEFEKELRQYFKAKGMKENEKGK
ncbi:MAG: hypothetical protein A2Y82_01285 [Candidatus Buchananbacteria bacterium RBG_13_36_9]|uniref:Uncharacterized protein n=1 Tax=Candidatus Buchananbacteria bacterium RBG_13_36_9 TaxID=1797530 RepID=A0A1G1XNS0_9BACT|nr:MAG: hypothetical protein A2Y82_01285 [Candidatus Buchananbacteria bacterium RBG_13_36_9]